MALERQQSVGQWILLHALTRPEGEILRTLAGGGTECSAPLGPKWSIRWIEGQGLEEAKSRAGRFVTVSREEDGEDLTAALTWTYPYAAAVQAPSKLTATQLKGRVLDQEAAQEAQGAPQTAPEPIRRPDFIAHRQGLTAAQKGTALHLAMQYLPLEGDHSPEAIAEAVAGMVRDGFLTSLQGEAVKPEVLSAFFTSPLGRELAQAKEVHREFKFSLLTPAGDYLPGLEGEEVLLQGVVDCCFETLEGITVVDFKTDRVDRRSVAARAEEYRPQLAAYSRALEEITGKPVIRRCLWFFALDQAVDV